MTQYTQAYVDLLIKQYYDKPNAIAEITAQAATFEKIRDIAAAIPDAFDVDLATGNRLDIIGKIVGLLRNRPEFSDDNEYRFFLKIKIAQNAGSAFMVSDTKPSVQDVIQFAFDGLAYVIDNKDMSLSLYISSAFNINRLLLTLELGLLHKPQAVGYRVIMVDPTLPFGFLESTGVYGFAELGLYELSIDGVDVIEISAGDTLGFNDRNNPLYYSTSGVYSELFET